MSRLLLTTALVCAATAAAFAQDRMSSDGSATGGMTMSNHATMQLHVVKTAPADVMSSKLIGATVYNNQNDNVGEVEDLVIKDGKTIAGVVVSVGGFLGIGESYVLVDPSSIALSDKDGTLKAYVDTSKDQLKNQPKFTYKKKS